MGRTDGRTDVQGGDYMLHRYFSGSIKNRNTLALLLVELRAKQICCPISDSTEQWLSYDFRLVAFLGC